MSVAKKKSRVNAFAQGSTEGTFTTLSSSLKPRVGSKQPGPLKLNDSGAVLRQQRAETARVSAPDGGGRGNFNHYHNSGGGPDIGVGGSPTAKAGDAIDTAAVVAKPEVHPGKPRFYPDSEYGDSFMDTTVLTTPRDDRTEHATESEDGDEPRDLKEDSDKRYSSQMHVAPRYRGPERMQASLQFLVGDDGRMEVGDADPSRTQLELGDGFLRGSERTRTRSSYHDKKASSGIHVLRKQGPSHEQTDYKGADKPGSPTRTTSQRREKQNKAASQLARLSIGSTQRQGVDGSGEDGFENEADKTPKARKTLRCQTSPQRLGNVSEREVNQMAVGKKRWATPEYNDSALESMALSDLQSQPFDLDPARVSLQIGNGSGSMKLEDKLKQQQVRDEEEQRSLFAAMSLEDWEATGDWFAAEFAKIMTQLREARREKRRILCEFESEIALREQCVRARSEGIDRKLDRMKHDGQRVMEEFQS